MIGLGVGIPYGYFGLNIQHPISSHTDFTFGFGSTFGGTAANIGARYYPNSTDSGLRFTFLYGTNGVVREEDCGILSFLPCGDFSTHEGFSIGLGWGSNHSDEGWDFDILYILTSDAFDRVEELEDRGDDVDGPSDPYLSFSFGYHW